MLLISSWVYHTPLVMKSHTFYMRAAVGTCQCNFLVSFHCFLIFLCVAVFPFGCIAVFMFGFYYYYFVFPSESFALLTSKPEVC